MCGGFLHSRLLWIQQLFCCGFSNSFSVGRLDNFLMLGPPALQETILPYKLRKIINTVRLFTFFVTMTQYLTEAPKEDLF